MMPMNGALLRSLIRKYIMHDKQWSFKFRVTNVNEIGRLLLPLKIDKPWGFDNLGGILLQLLASSVVRPVALCFKEKC